MVKFRGLVKVFSSIVQPQLKRLFEKTLNVSKPSAIIFFYLRSVGATFVMADTYRQKQHAVHSKRGVTRVEGQPKTRKIEHKYKQVIAGQNSRDSTDATRHTSMSKHTL